MWNAGSQGRKDKLRAEQRVKEEEKRRTREGKKKAKIYKRNYCISEVYCLLLIPQCQYSW